MQKIHRLATWQNAGKLVGWIFLKYNGMPLFCELPFPISKYNS